MELFVIILLNILVLLLANIITIRGKRISLYKRRYSTAILDIAILQKDLKNARQMYVDYTVYTFGLYSWEVGITEVYTGYLAYVHNTNRFHKSWNAAMMEHYNYRRIN